MTGRAEQIYNSATHHANLFSLIQSEMDGPTMTQSLIRYEELKVHFLFPNVDDDFRALLLKLAVRRLGMVVCRNSPDSAGKYELARDFESFSKDAAAILDDLLPVQAEIVKEKYLKPPPRD